MIFKLSSLLILALALSSLGAVTAISVPRSVHDGQLNTTRRDGQDVRITFYEQKGV
jgi:hypothetical protein